ncbi:MAG TPA: GNAT family N-acetyltransferase [Vicinamibacterales bacterium]
MTTLAQRLPDEPCWLETRGMLLSGRCRLLGTPSVTDGFVLRATDTPLAVVVGRPRPDLIEQAVDRRDLSVLAQTGNASHVSQALPTWKETIAILHAVGDRTPLAGALGNHDVRLLDLAEPLPDMLPPALREELRIARHHSPLAVAYSHGEAAAFCYAAWETETLWDVSIDTLEAHRGRGLGGSAVALLAQLMREKGKAPVWGALDTNVASMRLARKLGFVPVDRLTLFATDTPSPFFKPVQPSGTEVRS